MLRITPADCRARVLGLNFFKGAPPLISMSTETRRLIYLDGALIASVSSATGARTRLLTVMITAVPARVGCADAGTTGDAARHPSAGTRVVAIASEWVVGPGTTLIRLREPARGDAPEGFAIRVDLSDPKLRAGLLYPGRIAAVQPLSTMTSRAGAFAAVNGDFFNIGRNGAPVGLVVSGGQLLNGPNAVASSRRASGPTESTGSPMCGCKAGSRSRAARHASCRAQRHGRRSAADARTQRHRAVHRRVGRLPANRRSPRPAPDHRGGGYTRARPVGPARSATPNSSPTGSRSSTRVGSSSTAPSPSSSNCSRPPRSWRRSARQLRQVRHVDRIFRGE